MPNFVWLLLTAILALLTGAALMWLLARQKEASLRLLLAERDQGLKSELEARSALQSRVESLVAAEAQLAAVSAINAERQSKIAELELLIESIRGELSLAQSDLTAMRAASTEQLSSIERERTRFLDEQKRLEDAFGQLSKQALAQAQQSFMELANEKFTDARKLSAEQLDKILLPVRETLTKLETHTKEIESRRTESYAELNTKLRDLTTTTTQLVNALRRPEVRGSWGEHTMRQTAERAGLVEGSDFKMQVNVRTDDGDLRPDMLVYLPNRRELIVDSKTPIQAYLEAIELEEGPERRQKLKEHALQVKRHIGLLAQKSYQRQFESADMVVMFVPSEALFQTALQEDPGLMDDAFNRGVVIASPMTLFALLRTVAEGARQVRAMEEIKKIVELGGLLYDSVANFSRSYAKLGKALQTAIGSYNEGTGTLERHVLSRSRRMKEHGVKSAKVIEDADPVDASIRLPSAIGSRATGPGEPIDGAPGTPESGAPGKAPLTEPPPALPSGETLF